MLQTPSPVESCRAIGSHQPAPSTRYRRVHHARCFERPDQLKFEVLRSQIVEEPPTLPEENRDEMDLHLVEKAPGRRHSCAVLAPCGITSRSPAAALACATQDSMPSVTNRT